MAVTLSAETGGNFVIGNKRVKTYSVTFDSSYPTGGEDLSAATLGFKSVLAFIPCGPFRKTSDGSNAIGVSYKRATAKLFAYWQTDPGAVGGAAIPNPEVSNTTDLSGYAGVVLVIGTGTP